MMSPALTLTHRSPASFSHSSTPVVHLAPQTLAPSHLHSAPRQRRVSAPALGLATQLITVVGLGAAAFLLARTDPLLEQDNSERRNNCPTCEGRGVETCMCARWSDDDIGCNACQGSGRMKCRSCGGGGTAVPILVPIRKVDPQR